VLDRAHEEVDHLVRLQLGVDLACLLRVAHERDDGLEELRLTEGRVAHPGLQPHQVIDFFMGTIQHSIVMWEYRNRRYRLTGQFEPMFRVLWGGIRAA
jgi:hypothetical protein